MIPGVQMSTITKHRARAPIGLGAEIQLGDPLTRAFVSAVETGRCLPSLRVLILFAERLQTSPAQLLDPVKHDLSALYTRRHGTCRDALPRT